MRSVIIRSLVVIGVGGLILAGVLYVASTVDGRPPTVLAVRLTQPVLDDDRRASITTSIEVVFSEPVDTGSAEAAVALQPGVTGAVSWSGSTMTFTPDSPLELDAAYTLVIGPGIRDVAGNVMTGLPGEFEFETAGRPTLSEAEPADGAVDVALDEPIELSFTTLMDTSSVEAQLRLRPSFAHELRWSGRLLEIVPTEPLHPGTEYEVTIGAEATDISGVPLGDPARVGFRTVAAGLTALTLIPADGIDGIATSSPIAVIFDRPLDPASVSSELLTITPTVAGSVGVARLPDDPPSEDGAGSILVFTPSGQLPANTTFSVALAPGVLSEAGGGLTTVTTWTFTTGVPFGEISNQITFISERGGIANVWAANPDGTGQRQLSAELTGVTDYALAPDGDSLVIADGRRLVYQLADGTERRILTDGAHVEFDPAYSPDGRRVAFARADAATGEGLGLWVWVVGSASAERIVLPLELGEDPDPTDEGGAAPAALRAPRYSPDGQALAFVDAAGSIGLLELPAERLTRAPFAAAAAPIWLPTSSGVLLTGQDDPQTDPNLTVEAPVAPLTPSTRDAVFRLSRSGTSVNPSPFGIGSRVVGVAAGGDIAYVDLAGSLWLTDLPNTAPGRPALEGAGVRSAAFGPGDSRLVLEVGDGEEPGRIEIFDPTDGGRTELVDEGWRPRWLP